MIYLLAVLAAVANGGSSVLWRKAAATLPDEDALRLSLMRHLVRRPAWALGMLALLAGFLLQAAALGDGPLSLVEPVLVLELPFALLLGGLAFRAMLSRRDWLAVGTVTVGLAGMIYAASPEGGDAADVASWRWMLALVADIGALAFLIGVARGVRGDLRAVVLGVATGVGWGFSAALIKATMALVPHGLGAVLSSWKPYAMVAIGAAALFLFQNAVQAGRLMAAQPAVTITDPVVSVLFGLIVYAEHVRTGPWLIAEIACALLVATGCILLSRSPLLAPPEAQPVPR